MVFRQEPDSLQRDGSMAGWENRSRAMRLLLHSSRHDICLGDHVRRRFILFRLVHPSVR
jgi:hypothetical protein